MMIKTVLLISSDTALVERFRHAVPDYGILWSPGPDGALDSVQRSDVDVCVWDASLPDSTQMWSGFANQFRRAAPYVAVLHIGDEADVVPPPAFTISRNASPEEIRSKLQAAVDYRVMLALAALRSPAVSPVEHAAHDTAVLTTRVLTRFSQAFANVLEPSRALDAFLNAVGDLVQPARSGVFLRSIGSGFTLATARGFAKTTNSTIGFASHLVHWLVSEGRPATTEILPPDAARELARFNAGIAIPLIADGHLLGILVLGPPVVRGAYAEQDLEVLFELGTHLALALRAAEFHRELEDQKRLAESVVTYMASGIVILGRDERILSINHRAAEILHVAAPEILGAGIRSLPSPLGDLLVAALQSVTTREELQIPGTATWVAVTAVPVPGNDGPRAAVLSLEDITARRELAKQQRSAEQMQLLTAIVSRIADEIKNPLVSIRIFSELLPDRYDDAAFRKEFGAIVGRDVRRVVRALEILTTLIGPQRVESHPVDINALVEDVAREAAEQLAFDTVDIEIEAGTPPAIVTTDQGQLAYALNLLIDFLVSRSPHGTGKIIVSVNRTDDTGVVVKLESPTAVVPTEHLHLLFDPFASVHQGLRDLGPAVAARILDAAGGVLRCDQERIAVVFRLCLPLH